MKSSPAVDPITGWIYIGSHDHHVYSLDIEVHYRLHMYWCMFLCMCFIFFFFRLLLKRDHLNCLTKSYLVFRKIHFWKKFGNAWICDLDFWHLLQNQWGYLYTHHITFARVHCNLETIPDRETSYADIKKGDVLGRVELSQLSDDDGVYQLVSSYSLLYERLAMNTFIFLMIYSLFSEPGVLLASPDWWG